MTNPIKTRHGLYLRRRKMVQRIIAFALILLFSTASGIILHANATEQKVFEKEPRLSATHKSNPDQSTSFSRLCVEPGDTLWSIAKKYRGEEVSVKQYMFEIMKLNQLQSASLSVGQVLLLP